MSRRICARGTTWCWRRSPHCTRPSPAGSGAKWLSNRRARWSNYSPTTTPAAATGPLPLARALVALAGSPAPEAALAAAKSSTVLRVQRLADPEPNHPLLAAGTYTVAVLLLVVPTITVAAPIVKALVDAAG